MNTMMVFFLFQWFEAIVAKLVIIPFQIGLWSLNDSPLPYVSWWSSDVQDMIILTTYINTDKTLIILIAGFMIWHYAYSMIFGILNLGVERIFATVFLKDYENKPRWYIPVILLIGTHLITVPFSLLVLMNQTGFYIATLPCFLNSVVTFKMFIIVWKVNENRRKRMEMPGRDCDYSLSQTFQVKENYRALKLAKNLMIVVLCAMSVPCALLITLVIGLIPSWKMLFIHVMENSIYLNPIIICTVLMFSAPTWRQQYLKYVPKLKWKSSKIFIIMPLPTRDTEGQVPDEGQVYFEQLRTAWT